MNYANIDNSIDIFKSNLKRFIGTYSSPQRWVVGKAVESAVDESDVKEVVVRDV